MQKDKEIRLLIYLVLIVLIYYVGYILIYQKTINNQLLKKKAEFYAARKILKEKKESLDSFNKVAALFKSKRDLVSKVNQALIIDEKDQITNSSFIERVATKSKVSIEGFSFSELKQAPGGNAGILTANITVKGTYANFKNFLEEISSSFPLMEIQSISVGSLGGDKIESYSVEVGIYTKNAPAAETSPESENKGKNSSSQEGKNIRKELITP
jgi:hypothetical protein